MGILTALALFLKPLHSFVKLNYLLLHIRNTFFVFSHCDGWLREFGLCFPYYLYVMFIITLECSKLWIWMGIYFRDILLIRISMGAKIVSNVYLRKTFHNGISPNFKFLLPNERLDLCDKKGLTMQINFHSLLWSYLPRVPIFLAMTVYSRLQVFGESSLKTPYKIHLVASRYNV